MSLVNTAATWARRAARTEALRTTALGNGLTMGLGFFTGIITARGLSPAGRGVLFGVTLSGLIISWLAMLGADEAIVFAAGGDRRGAERVRRELVAAMRGQALIALVALSVLVVNITRHSSTATRSICLASVWVTLPSNIYSMVGAGVLRASQDYRRWNASRVLTPLVYAATTAALFVSGWLTSGTGVAALACGSAATALVMRSWLAHGATDDAPADDEIPEASHASDASHHSDARHASDARHGDDTSHARDTSHAGEAVPSAAPVRSLRRYGAQVTLFGAPNLVNQRLDQFILSLFVAPAQLGLYSVAIALSSLTQLLAGTVEQVMFPMLMTKDARRRRRITNEVLAVTFVAAVVVSGALIAATPALIRVLYGQKYQGATRAAQLLLVGAVFLVAAAPLIAYGKAIDRVKPLIFAQLVAGVVTVCLLFPGIHWYGIRGAAAVSAMAYGVALVIMLAQFVRRPPG